MHHLVSKGYQRNFADDRQRVVVIDKSTNRGELRPTKRTFAEPNYNSYTSGDGELVDELEREWSKVEAKTLRRVRELSPANARDPQMRVAVCSLMAVHLVRSKPFERVHHTLWGEVVTDIQVRIGDDERARRAFIADKGREPLPGEMAALASGIADQQSGTRFQLIDSMARIFNRVSAQLMTWELQVITIDPSVGASFILGDVPVAHARRASGRFGFRDGLAVGDADVIGAPITSTTAVLLTTERLPHVMFRTKVKVNALNVLFWLAAEREVAVHPSGERDALRIKDLARRPEALKPIFP
ncbi:MAG: DUF4238 domain-containing protein [Acidimicrobiia bacterium]